MNPGRWRSALLAALAASAISMAWGAVVWGGGGPEQNVLPTDDELAEFYGAVEEPEELGDILDVMLLHEETRGITFGFLGWVLAGGLWIVERLIRGLCKILPGIDDIPSFAYPAVVSFFGVLGGVSVAIHPLIDVSHGVQMAMQAVSVYSTGHGVAVMTHARYMSGGASAVIRRKGA